MWVRLAVDLLADLDAEDFASIAAAADQAAAIERLLFEEARSLPSDTADLAGVFLGRVAERIGDEPAALLLGCWRPLGQGSRPPTWRHCCPTTPMQASPSPSPNVLGDQLRTIDAAGRLTFAHAIVQWHAASLAGPGVHARIVEVLANDDAGTTPMLWMSSGTPSQPVQSPMESNQSMPGFGACGESPSARRGTRPHARY